MHSKCDSCTYLADQTLILMHMVKSYLGKCIEYNIQIIMLIKDKKIYNLVHWLVCELLHLSTKMWYFQCNVHLKFFLLTISDILFQHGMWILNILTVVRKTQKHLGKYIFILGMSW